MVNCFSRCICNVSRSCRQAADCKRTAGQCLCSPVQEKCAKGVRGRTRTCKAKAGQGHMHTRTLCMRTKGHFELYKWVWTREDQKPGDRLLSLSQELGHVEIASLASLAQAWSEAVSA